MMIRNVFFIEKLTHDAYFIQIPKITGKTSARVETVLSIFDQRCKVKDDNHRLKFDSEKTKTNKFLRLVFRILERLQGDVEMEELMSLEDTFLLEQEMLADEVRKDLKQAQKQCKEEQMKREEAQRRHKEAQKKHKEAQRKHKEEQKKREAAEQKLKELQALLDKKK